MNFGHQIDRMPENNSSLLAKVEEMEALAKQQTHKKPTPKRNFSEEKNMGENRDTASYADDGNFRGRNWRNGSGRGGKRWNNPRGRGRWTHNSDFGRDFHDRSEESVHGADFERQNYNNPRGFFGRPRGPRGGWRGGYGHPFECERPDSAAGGQRGFAHTRPPIKRLQSSGNWYKQRQKGHAQSSNLSDSNNITSIQLIQSLSQFSEFSATLLTLIDQFEYSHKQVKSIVAAHADVFELDGETVRLRPKIKLCYQHLDSDGCPTRDTCSELHICVEYIFGKCKHKGCLCGHNLYTNHNAAILKQFQLSTLEGKSLVNLLKLTNPRNSRKELKVCDDYNRGKCNKEDCFELHLCLKHLAKCCPAKDDCKLDHGVSGDKLNYVLEQHGVPVNETPRDILLSIVSCPLVKDEIEAIKDNFDSMDVSAGKAETRAKQDDATPKEESPPPPKSATPPPEKPVLKTSWSHEFMGEVTVAEICFDSVEGLCPYEESGCWRLHCDFHFHWQVRTKTEKKFWVNLTAGQSHALEAAYCDEAQGSAKMPPLESSLLPASGKKLLLILNGRSTWEAHFDSMELKLKNNSLELRRLCTQSTPNKVIAPCTFKWYFSDKNQTWIEYGKVDSTGEEKLKCNLSSDAIESHLKQSPSAPLQFKSDSFSYSLDLQKMTQTNLGTSVSRAVRRRPRPHLETKETSSGSGAATELPSAWEAMQPDERIKRVTLSPSSEEYKKLIAFIQTTGSNLNILKIERVQNPYLWRAFQNKVQELSSLYKSKAAVNIQQLFHGTKPDIVPKICEENFDWRLHGSNVGQAYGRGTYFAPLSSTSHGYTHPDASGHRFMFLALVAVGTLTPGNASMTRPPINPQYNVPFDSTANAVPNPSIIVKYDKQEYFPEYILTFT